MIISRTPLRISFLGGGTDFRPFYERGWGAVTSVAIDKYIYIAVNPKFDHGIRVSYSRTELVRHVDEVKHDLVREAMKLTGVTRGVEIVSIADIPSRGTGLGSSSAFTVGLLHALHTYAGRAVTPERLAREAAHIEIDVLKEPIGKQDHYIAAYGGIRHFRFLPEERVKVTPLACDLRFQRKLNRNLMLFYTGITRKARSILKRQTENIAHRLPILERMRVQAEEARDLLLGGDVMGLGALLHEGWTLKQQLTRGITSPTIERYYRKAMDAGAVGGKLLGAGQGGFLLFCCAPSRQDRVRRSLREMEETPFAFEPRGSRIVYTERRT
jgi:D-glycero-alpha-D-manno-heptose-7-phosphate kinase